jgi:hypothetical protein
MRSVMTREANARNCAHAPFSCCVKVRAKMVAASKLASGQVAWVRAQTFDLSLKKNNGVL